MSDASTDAARAKPRGADVPRTTTRGPSGRPRLGGRDCERAERLLLLCCRNHQQLNRGVIDYATWERRDFVFHRACAAAEAARRELQEA